MISVSTPSDCCISSTYISTKCTVLVPLLSHRHLRNAIRGYVTFPIPFAPGKPTKRETAKKITTKHALHLNLTMSAGGEHLKDEGTRRQTVLAGGTAGLISRFCIAPLDVVKIRLQLQIHSLSDPVSHRTVNGPIYKGTLSTMRAIVRQEGITVRLILIISLRCNGAVAVTVLFPKNRNRQRKPGSRHFLILIK